MNTNKNAIDGDFLDQKFLEWNRRIDEEEAKYRSSRRVLLAATIFISLGPAYVVANGLTEYWASKEGMPGQSAAVQIQKILVPFTIQTARFLRGESQK